MSLTSEPADDDFGTPYKELVAPSQPTPRAIRAWALEVGLPVGKRGKLSDDLILAYDQAHANR